MASTRAAQKLFVSNLPWTVSNRELRGYFSEFGKVFTANVIFDKRTGVSKRYGFVTIDKNALPNIEKRTKHTLENNNLIIQRNEQ